MRPVNTGRFAFQGGAPGPDLGGVRSPPGRVPRGRVGERVLDDALIAEAGRRLSEAAPPSSRVILFGSAARGELTQAARCAIAVTA